MKSFGDIFGGVPETTASAPGRVNLLGEHTDYNDGFVLPTAIPQRTTVSLKRSGEEWFNAYSADLDQHARFKLDSPPSAAFVKYLFGCVTEFSNVYPGPPLNLYIESTVPIGVGLSSSAALEVATLRALNALCTAQVDDLTIALMAQRAETKHAGVKCGVMDQMAASFADIGSMLFIDTRTLERKLLPLPQGTEIAVIDSGVARSLANSKYNERRTECERAAELLHVPALRDISQIELLRDLPEMLHRRARHVVTENQRVLLAADGIDGKGFGGLMNASHRSLRDDFEVSVPAVDALVQSLQQQSGVYGARLTGAGFGGACVALCRQGEAHALASAAVAEFNAGNHRGRILAPASQSMSQ